MYACAYLRIYRCSWRFTTTCSNPFNVWSWTSGRWNRKQTCTCHLLTIQRTLRIPNRICFAILHIIVTKKKKQRNKRKEKVQWFHLKKSRLYYREKESVVSNYYKLLNFYSRPLNIYFIREETCHINTILNKRKACLTVRGAIKKKYRP